MTKPITQKRKSNREEFYKRADLKNFEKIEQKHLRWNVLLENNQGLAVFSKKTFVKHLK